MAILDYEIGGNIINQEGGEAILKIPCNKTLIADQFSFVPPDDPEIIYGLKSMKELFEHFKPAANISFEDSRGEAKIVVNEELRFNSLDDFAIENMVSRSPFLSGLQKRVDFYALFLMHLSRGDAISLDMLNKDNLLQLKERVVEMKRELMLSIES